MSRASRDMVPGPAWSTSSPRRLALGSEVPQRSPALPGDSCSGRWPALSTSSPGRLGPMPEGLRARPDVPADLGPCSSACGVDQLSRATRAPVRCSAKSTGSPGRLARGSEGPQGRPVPPGDSGLGRVLAGPPDLPDNSRSGPRARRFDKNSRVTRVRFFCPTGSTTCPARLTPASEAPGGLPAVLSILGQCPSARVFRPALPGDSGPGPWARAVDQLSRTIRAGL